MTEAFSLGRLFPGAFPADATRAVAGVAFDSRKVRPGEVFIALAGAKADGARFIADAIANCHRPGLEGGDTDPQRLFISAWSTFHGLATLIVGGQLKSSVGSDAELEALGNSVTDVIYRGLSFSGL